MITNWLQDRLDVLRLTSRQRWAFVAVAVTAIVVASVAIRVEAGRDPSWITIWLGLVALVAAARPGSHTGLFVIAVVGLLWLGNIDEVTSPLAIAVAMCLFVFHAVLALMAVTPHSAVVGGPVLWRWFRRGAVVAGATVAVWGLVELLARIEAPGDAGLTAGAFVVLAAAALALRARTLAPRSPGW